MAGRPRRLRRKTYYAMRMKRAVQLLFYKRHREPGAKGWELRRRLGSDYMKVLDLLNDYLDKLGLTVKTVFEEEANPPENPSLEQLDKARFYVTLKGSEGSQETKLIGWRIDDLAGLAVTLSFIISKGGKTPRKDLETLLRTKLPGWRVDLNLHRYLRAGYIVEDENGQLYLGWRTRAEVDQKKLVDLLLEAEP
ncbi:hypothetical protein CW712_04550 [Candidatus Bathyarchaeota archaeon]|nr:MAG: hypothetical protein CW712_04550 [Candidatus Bathyarchaeota archaeon]